MTGGIAAIARRGLRFRLRCLFMGHEDAFARNGAAEVLQDVGFVDFLALDDPRSRLLERIYAAGGERFREAAETRIAGAVAQKEEAA